MFKRGMWFLCSTTVCLFILLTLLISLASASEIRILAPTDGSNVKSKEIFIIGKAEESVKEVEIKGISGDALKVKTDNGVFSVKVTLSSNDSTISITGDDGSSTGISLKVNGSGSFNYHPDESEVTDCKSTCHSDSSNGYAVQPASTVCYECHDANNEKKYVHGPINMGICGTCHMPHGSSNASFLTATKETLCQVCHDELMTTHPDVKSKLCIDCHDPHSSDKEFHMK